MTTDTPNPVGRPDSYTTEISDIICGRLAQGESMRTVCLDSDMPSRTTLFRWMREHEQFLNQYARAKQESADALTDEMIDIADDGSNDWMEKFDKDGESLGYQLNGEHVQRSKLRIDTRKWLAAKMKPKKFGDSVALTGPGGGAININTNPTLTKEEAKQLLSDDG